MYEHAKSLGITLVTISLVPLRFAFAPRLSVPAIDLLYSNITTAI